MLIERSNVVVGDVITIKLISGEEVVGKLTDQTDDQITISKPVMISLQPVSNKQMGLTFMPVLGSVEPDVTLQIPVLAMAIRPVKTSKSVASSYIQTTSGLLTPNTPGLVS